MDDENYDRVRIGPVLFRPGLFGIDVRGPGLDQRAVIASSFSATSIWVTWDNRRRVGIRATDSGALEAFIADRSGTLHRWYGPR